MNGAFRRHHKTSVHASLLSWLRLLRAQILVTRTIVVKDYFYSVDKISRDEVCKHLNSLQEKDRQEIIIWAYTTHNCFVLFFLCLYSIQPVHTQYEI